MTSISGMSPADRIEQMLQTAVTSGTVKSADQSALSSAISDIDTQLQSGAKVSPSDMKSKVNGLVDQEVTDGKLTSDQADELKQVFAQASQAMGHHHGGHHMKVSGDSNTATDITSTDPSTIDGSSTTSSTSTSGSSTTDSLTSSINTLMSFLQKLESATSSATNYTASGSSATSSAQSMLANLFA